MVKKTRKGSVPEASLEALVLGSDLTHELRMKIDITMALIQLKIKDVSPEQMLQFEEALLDEGINARIDAVVDKNPRSSDPYGEAMIEVMSHAFQNLPQIPVSRLVEIHFLIYPIQQTEEFKARVKKLLDMASGAKNMKGAEALIEENAEDLRESALANLLEEIESLQLDGLPEEDYQEYA